MVFKKQTHLVLAAALLMGTACKPADMIQPSVKPSSSPQPSLASNLPSATVDTGSLALKIVDSATKAPLANAAVKVSGSKIGEMQHFTNADGQVSIEKLPTNENYSIAVSQSGYLSKAVTLRELELDILANSSVDATITLARAKAIVTGKVRDGNGVPVSQAVVSNGSDSALTDDNGQYNLAISTPGKQSLTISKLRFENASLPNLDLRNDQALPDVQLATDRAPHVRFSTAKVPFGNQYGETIDLMTPLIRTLTENGFEVDQKNDPLTVLDGVDILVIVAPALPIDTEEQAAIARFVQNGKKLVILGEWGGYGAYEGRSINEMLRPFNLSLGFDLIRDSGGSTDLNLMLLGGHALGKGVNSLKVYQASSILSESRGVAPFSPDATTVVAKTSGDGLRLASVSPASYGIVAASLYGSGKCVVTGDASFLSSADSDGNSIIDLNEADNRQFALNIFNW